MTGFSAGGTAVKCQTCETMVPPFTEHWCEVRQLTPGEMSSLEKIAKLRGQLGNLRRKVRKAHRLLLEWEHVSSKPGYPIKALELLSAALEET